MCAAQWDLHARTPGLQVPKPLSKTQWWWPPHRLALQLTPPPTRGPHIIEVLLMLLSENSLEVIPKS